MLDKMSFTELYSLLKCVDFLKNKYDTEKLLNNIDFNDYRIKRNKLNKLYNSIIDSIELNIEKL